jgi:hypothetical protein
VGCLLNRGIVAQGLGCNEADVKRISERILSWGLETYVNMEPGNFHPSGEFEVQ